MSSLRSGLHVKRGRTFRRRRFRAAFTVGLGVIAVWLAVSLGSALTNPTYGSSLSARFAEWARQHGGASVVDWTENEWYSHHPPKVGGKPPAGAIKTPAAVPKIAATSGPAHLTPPAPIEPFASPAIPGEGQWSPAGRSVGGIPAVYTTTLRPDAVHTSYVVGVAWMDTKLLKATLYSGSQIPGGGPYTNTAPVGPAASDNLVAAFNAGFLMSEAQGGYYTDGKTVIPLRTGAASFVVNADGTATVGQWGRDVSMTSDVVSVRQNLDLLVDNGQPVPGLNAADTTQWGFTLGNQVYVWRSGLGVTADGALVYVGGPGLNITDLANLLVRAGAVRGMELDINTTWVNFSSYDPSTAAGQASAGNGTELLTTMAGSPGRYFESWWARDFITMSARTTANVAATPRAKHGSLSARARTTPTSKGA
ncbi:MAG: phosphodiester glycosidase family protein [Acidimicrobiales bacterium]